MGMVEVFVLILVSVVVMVTLIVLGVAWLLPAASQATEELRIQREAEAASWRIHQRATSAFGEMLKVAREAEHRP